MGITGIYSNKPTERYCDFKWYINDF